MAVGGGVTVSLSAARDVAVAANGFEALTSEPWLALDLEAGALAGRWIELVYETPLTQAVARPALRFSSGAGDVDVILPAAGFGRAIWRGRAPEGVTGIAISPVDVSGPFRFRIASLKILSPWRCLARAPRLILALWSFVLEARGQRREAWRVRRRALNATPLEHYSTWRDERRRLADWDGFDAPPEGGKPHLRLLADNGDAEAARWRAYLSAQPVKQASLGGLSGPRDIVAQAADLAAADLIAIVTAQTHLSTDALAVVQAAAMRSAADVFYADEETPGESLRPWLKPDWSPILAESVDLIGSAWFVRAGWARAHLGRASLDDAARPTIAPDDSTRVGHIDRVLWQAPRRPRRLGPSPALRLSGDLPLVSVIIPTKDRADLLRRAVEGVKRAGCACETVVVDNGSCEPATADYFRELGAMPGHRVLARPGEFNFSWLCNEGARSAQGQILLFLNNDTEAVSDNWVADLAAWTQRENLGAVGAKLLYPDHRIQHAGVTVGIDGHCNHFEAFLAADAIGYFERFDVPHETSAVTGACLAVDRGKFWAVDGFDEIHLPVEFSDIDLCLKLGERGWTSLVEPRVVLIHYEAATRKVSPDQEQRYAPQVAWFKARWRRKLRADPYFHRLLSLDWHKAALG